MYIIELFTPFCSLNFFSPMEELREKKENLLAAKEQIRKRRSKKKNTNFMCYVIILRIFGMTSFCKTFMFYMHHCECFHDLWMEKKGFLFNNVLFFFSLMAAESIVVWNPYGNALISDQKFWSGRLLNSVRLPAKFIDVCQQRKNKWMKERATQKMGPSMKTIKLDIFD